MNNFVLRQNHHINSSFRTALLLSAKSCQFSVPLPAPLLRFGMTLVAPQMLTVKVVKLNGEAGFVGCGGISCLFGALAVCFGIVVWLVETKREM